MKKVFALILILTVLLTAGCTGKRTEPTAPLDGNTTQTGSTGSAQGQTAPSENAADETDGTQAPTDTTDTTTTAPVTEPSEPSEESASTTPTTTPATQPTTPSETPTTPPVDTETDTEADTETDTEADLEEEPKADTEPDTEPDTSPAQSTAATMTKQSYNGLNYWLYTPANPTANMPLIVYLHGGSGKGEDLDLLTDVDGFPQYIKDGRISCSAYIIFPQCPSSQRGWKTMGDKIEALIGYTCSAYDLNTNRVSLTGHSMGGTGVWTLALDKPGLFCKIAPMSGSVTVNDNNLAALSGIPVWAFVGDSDTIVSPDTSIAMVDGLTQMGANAKITVLEGTDHFAVPGLGYLGTDVISWLIS